VMAVEPPRHAQPTDLDAVLLQDEGLPRVFRRPSGADEHEALFAQMPLRFSKAGLALVEDVIVGEGDYLHAAGLQRLQQRDRSIELERLRSAGGGWSDRSFQIDEAEVSLAEDIGYT